MATGAGDCADRVLEISLSTVFLGPCKELPALALFCFSSLFILWKSGVLLRLFTSVRRARSVADTTGATRRLIFSTSFRDVQSTALHTKIPLVKMVRECWVNLCIDVRHILASCFGGIDHKATELIIFTGTCKVRSLPLSATACPLGFIILLYQRIWRGSFVVPVYKHCFDGSFRVASNLMVAHSRAAGRE
jgi:hypothetical protein